VCIVSVQRHKKAQELPFKNSPLVSKRATLPPEENSQ
jgi:hypothetical protein